MTIWDSIASAINDAKSCSFTLASKSPIGGGSINNAYRLDGTDGSRFFLKLNDARHHPIFIAECAGLAALSETNTIRVPRPVTHGKSGNQSYLVLEYLKLNSFGNSRQLGEQLAAMHRCTASRFGFVESNFIGTTLQPNDWKDSWIDFWREHRLGFQLQLAAQNGYSGQLQRLGEKLSVVLPSFFDNYSPQPSLLHGDLWSGNHGFMSDGTAVIFDPAAYYGDRECDIAMTELFGGYPSDFYVAYRAAYPLDAGYVVRKELYNLYHILNHANLFDGSYARQAEQMMTRLLGK